ncbi:MAG: dihydropteroate synthase [Deltaproteobacteria bacterium RBG_13_61_14]|nr:MAG: dihydropteroate synthase [Deltaproteobacteria bacterium RBG_13_61_14]
MLTIAENINVMSKPIGPAMKARDKKPIQELAVHESEQGVDYLDLNIGPARKDGPELMTWLVQTVQEVSKVPCSLDTTNADAIAAGLKVHQGKALINSVTLQPDRMQKVLPLAKEFETDIIGVLWGQEGMPRDENERAVHAVNLMMAANELGVPNERLWVDPIVSPVSVEINQVKACITFMQTLQDLVPGCKSTVGLSNISNGAPDELRHWLNKTYAIMLMRYGCYSAIVDAFDEDLLALAKGGKKEVIALVHKVMDGAAVDPKSLNPELLKYYRTAKVLVGETLYSASWLEG